MLGIGGVSMSSLAIFLKEMGFEVSGYDEKQSKGTKVLKQHKIEVDFLENFDKIDMSDTVVFSSAIKSDNKLFQHAKKCKKKILSRGQILGFVSRRYEKVIAIAGSHGKTTTTAMIFQILNVAGFEPTLHFGGFKIDDKKNYSLGENEYFVTEACEYHDNFLNLYPYISVITNIEKEHMDYFKTFNNQLASFEKFRNQSLIVVDDVENLKAKYLRHDENGNLIFSLFDGNKKIMRLHLKICEEINTQNCIYAYLVAKKLGISDQTIKLGLESFCGVENRFERVRSKFFDNVILDYAHHPTEIEKALKTAKKVFKNKKIISVFQPHTYSRTKTLLKEFLEVFKGEDTPLFFKTYSAREKPEEGISAQEFVEILKKYNKNALFFENFENLRDYFSNFNKKDTVLIFIGAGDLPEILNKNKFIE